jgi:hypothetical protein
MALSENEGGGERKSDIAWVGQQWRMEGYCGRATMPEIAEQAATDTRQVQQEQTTEDGRTVAVVKTLPWQGKIARIGPPKTPLVTQDDGSAQATG